MSQKRHKGVQSTIHVEGLASDRRIHSEFLEEGGKVAKMYVAIDTFIGRREGKNYRTLILDGGVGGGEEEVNEAQHEVKPKP